MNVIKHFLLAGLATGLSLAAAGVAAQEDHSQHKTHDHSQMTQAQFEVLRSKISAYNNMTDKQIVKSMSRMKNIGGVMSQEGVTGKVGILALSHGYDDNGNRIWKEAFKTINSRYPVAYAMGMSMMTSAHIQDAVDKLEAAGAEKIIVIRAETGERNSLTYQWDYAFERRDESAYLDVPRIETNAKIIWTESHTAHPIVSDILLDNALTLSIDPRKEVVLVMGHGAMTDEDNQFDLDILAKHASHIKAGGGFADVMYYNVQDDLPAGERAANVRRIRKMVQDKRDAGFDVIAVTNATTEGFVPMRLKLDVKKLGVRFYDKGIMQNPRFRDWVEETVRKNDRRGFKKKFAAK